MKAFRDRRGGEPRNWKDGKEVREALLQFIADFSDWENSTDRDFLETSRALVQVAYEALGGAPRTRPLVVDPFAGGGAIPFEALRIGADAFASDLNPIAALLNKVLIEYIPKFGSKLADEVRESGKAIGRELERRTADLYPSAGKESPVTYLWARKVRCVGPNCGAWVPLLRSLVLAKRGRRNILLRLMPDSRKKSVGFEIVEAEASHKLGDGTVRRGAATCPVCSYTTSVTFVRQQLKEQRGGAESAMLVCVVMRAPDGTKTYRLPTRQDHVALDKVRSLLCNFATAGAVPDESLPVMSGVFNAPLYGMTKWAYLFSPRQLVAICTLTELITEFRSSLLRDAKDQEFAAAVATCLFLARDKSIDFWTSLCSWIPVGEKIGHTFGRQALGMIWDFAEGVPTGDMSGSWNRSVEYFVEVLEHGTRSSLHSGIVSLTSATASPLPDDCALALVTDPPYYNAVPYADLSDFFYVWLRRSCALDHQELFATRLAPKDDELCEMSGWDPDRYPHKDARFYEEGMGRALAEGRRVLAPGGVGVIVFAHKTTQGWETLLNALISAGWIVTASWPIDTERGARLRAMGSAALASSIHLVCRPREMADGSPCDKTVGDWRDVLAELPGRIHEWMPRLAREGVVGADAIFACLGPALQIFSRYSHVEKASGETVTLREYLEHVWAAVAKEALTLVFEGADATGFEPDARLTAMWLWTINANANGKNGEERIDEDSDDESEGSAKKPKAGGLMLEYDAARKIAQGLGAHLEDLDSLVEVSGETARLLPVAERARHLFGKDEGKVAAPKRKKREPQMNLFKVLDETTVEESSFGEVKASRLGETILDRVHQSMVLFATNRNEALKRFLVDDGVGSDQRFWRLADCLSKLYPSSAEEKRWVDGVLARKKGLGF